MHNSFDESESDKGAFGHWLCNAFSCKKIIHSAFQISVPSIPKILNILKKTWNISSIGGGGGGGEEQGLHVCNYQVLKCDVVSFRVEDTKHFVLSVYSWNTSIGAHSFLHLVMDSYYYYFLTLLFSKCGFIYTTICKEPMESVKATNLAYWCLVLLGL